MNGHLIIEQLVGLGCELFCIAPGSRSTPLVAAVAANAKAKSMISHDERSLGFFALGCAKATQKPAVIVVTSGTAVANLFPAVIEASIDHVPLIILSADRPAELRGLGVNQTIDQIKIFSDYVRYFFDLSEQVPSEFVRSQVTEAYVKSLHVLPGPVQLNCQFREPFNLDLANATESCFFFGPPILTDEQVQSLRECLKRAEHGLVVVGAMKTRSAQKAVLRIIESLGWPAICDVTSGLRFLNHPLINHSREFSGLQTDCVLQLGGRLILKPPSAKTHIYVDAYLENHDPGLTVTHRIQCDLEWLSGRLK
ncbi:MAG: 2-succinyl-5-enolpyruvyl-6-hydroxy-3-cyclohexene-1-carboxylic-acid synthase [Myxococcaceae bacterium]